MEHSPGEFYFVLGKGRTLCFRRASEFQSLVRIRFVKRGKKLYVSVFFLCLAL